MSTYLKLAIILCFCGPNILAQTPLVNEIMTKYRTIGGWGGIDSLRIDSIDLYDEQIGFFNMGYPFVAVHGYRADSLISQTIYNDMGMLARLDVNERDFQLTIKMERDGLSVAEVVFHDIASGRPRERYTYIGYGILDAKYVQKNDTCETFERYNVSYIKRYEPPEWVASKGCLCNGHFDGEIVHYHDNGSISSVENWSYRQRNGIRHAYSPEGLLLSESWFENGVMRWNVDHDSDRIIYITYDENGRLLKALTLDKTAGDTIKE